MLPNSFLVLEWTDQRTGLEVVDLTPIGEDDYVDEVLDRARQSCGDGWEVWATIIEIVGEGECIDALQWATRCAERLARWTEPTGWSYYKHSDWLRYATTVGYLDSVAEVG